MKNLKLEILEIEEVEEEVEVWDIEVADDHSFVVEGVIVHNCLICAGDDGKIFYYNKNIDAAPLIPRHPRCRCVYAPASYSWRELGIDKDEIPPSTRASLDGQVPAIEKYSDWFKKQDVGWQKDFLGPTRYKLWSEGKLKLTEMAKDNKIIPVSALSKRFPEIVKKAPTKAVSSLQDLAINLRSTALISEPATTKSLTSIANTEDARMEGLPFRVKSSKSTLRKFISELKDNPSWSIADLEKYDANDLLRYTMLAEEGKYTETVAKSLQRLTEKGHKVERIKNYWGTSHYKGINAVMRNPQGIKYELQFHTPESIHVKEKISHPLYEKIREAEKLGLSSKQVAALEKEMIDAWASLNVPEGISGLSNVGDFIKYKE